ncbi:unnamed protein product [marine sediment metagenome]|uniref:Uncharacterized protein n=1 Tax=marine sediment metagenome TaxID=412755 RepID=X1VWH2_9ZZZZ
MKAGRGRAYLISDMLIDADIDMHGHGLADLGATLLKSGGYIRLEDSLLTDLDWSGIAFTGTAGEDLVKFNTVYRTGDATYKKAQADLVGTMPVMALAVEAIANGETGLFILFGWIRDDRWDLGPGSPAYQSVDDAGAVITTIPAASGNQVQKVGIALTAKIAHFNPIYTVFQIT